LLAILIFYTDSLKIQLN